MAKKIISEPSRTLAEFRLLPGYTSENSTIDKISLRTMLAAGENEEKSLFLNIPLVAAAMQSVSGPEMAIEMAKQGGTAIVFCSQTIENQAEMIRTIKSHKAGFVKPITVTPDMTIDQMFEIRKRTGYKTFPVVDSKGAFVGLLTKNDYYHKIHHSMKVTQRMVPASDLEVGREVFDLKTANNLLRESHQSVLPVTDSSGRLVYLVFRKDIENHLNNPLEVLDEKKRLLAVAAINSHDFHERIPALVEAGVDAVAIDSSDAFSAYIEKTLGALKSRYPGLPVIAGNVITGDGFDFLVKCGASAVKIGMGGGSICITQEQKGTGRGLATAIMSVVEARDAHFKKTGQYIPVIADGGIVTAKDIVVALSLGADSVMMGRYFARMEESPTKKVTISNRVMKPYWGEGSARAREWKTARYHQASFVEGVEGFVEYAGKLRDNLPETLSKIKASISSVGVSTIKGLHENVELELVSALSIREGKVHDIYMPGNEGGYGSRNWDG